MRYFKTSVLFFFINVVFAITGQSQDIYGAAINRSFQDFDKAIDTLDVYLSDLECDNCFEKAKAIKTKGIIYYYHNHFGKAIEFYDKAIAEFKLLDNAEEVINCQMNIGLVYEVQGEDSLAVTILNKTIAQAEAINFCSGFLKASYNLSNLFLKLRIEDKAKYHCNKILLHPCIGDSPSLEANAYNNLGSIQTEKQNYDSALFYHKKSGEIRKKNNLEVDLAESYLNIGAAYQRLDKVDSTLYYLKLAHPIFKQNNSVHGLAYVSQQLGISYFVKKNYLEALSNYLDAYDLAVKYKLFELEVDLNQNISMVYEVMGEHDKALAYLHVYNTLKDSIRGENENALILELEEKYKNQQKELQLSKLSKDKAETDLKNAQISKDLATRNYYIIILILAIALILFATIMLVKRSRNKREKEQLIASQKLSEIELKLMRMQMNPHFIFNVLNTIQAQISEGDTLNAEIQMAKLGQLIRNILNQSRKEWITIAEEIDQLKRYVSFEQLRFPEQFDFSVNVDASINIDEDSIPPMIIQPFIENAILHGLLNLKDRKGTIQLSFEMQNGELIVSIIDNGVGLDADQSLQKESTHVSLSTTIIKERLSLSGIENAFTIKNNEKGHGVVLTLKLPYQVF